MAHSASAMVTLRAASRLVRPCADLVEGAVEEHLHSLFARGLAKLIEGSPLLDELGQSGRDSHDLEDADPAAVAQAPALQAALGPIEHLAR